MIEQETVNRVDTLDDEGFGLLDAYWRAANYLSVGQIYLFDNPLLRVQRDDLDAIVVTGPGHG